MKRELTWEEFPFPEADLRRAARVAGQALTDALPQPEDCAYRFSQEFQRKMEQLIRKVDRSGWVTGLQRAACFFLALLLLFSIFYKTSQSNCISVSLSEG